MNSWKMTFGGRGEGHVSVMAALLGPRFAGIYTSEALAEGYEVYIITDASGGTTKKRTTCRCSG